MSDKVTAAIDTLRNELGFTALSVWAPGGLENGDVEIEAIFLARDEAALKAAAIELVTEGRAAS